LRSYDINIGKWLAFTCLILIFCKKNKIQFENIINFNIEEPEEKETESFSFFSCCSTKKNNQQKMGDLGNNDDKKKEEENYDAVIAELGLNYSDLAIQAEEILNQIIHTEFTNDSDKNKRINSHIIEAW
jgi:hypothetical protein